jgi:hypothetical protein
MRRKAMITGLVSILLACLSTHAAEGAERLTKEKLQIVFLFGQSNMVGLSDVRTAWYLTQPQYVPDRERALFKPEIFDWNSLYWQGVRTFNGPQEMKDQLMKLVDERRDSRNLWRSRAKSNDIAWKAEWGTKPEIKGRNEMYAFLDRKAIEEGIYKRMAAIIDSPENIFPAAKAYEEIISRDAYNAEHIQRVREIYLNGTKAENFDAFNAAVAAWNAANKEARKTVKLPAGVAPHAEADRAVYARLAQDHVNLPIAKRTYLSGFGAIAGSIGEGITSETSGPLSVGYGASVNTIGPEYAVGITLERLVDAPILLVKCAWGNTTINAAWRPGSLDGVETPIEKSEREKANDAEVARAKEEGREPMLRQAPVPTGKLSWAWNMALPHVKKVLADPGKYHPEYDAEAGYEIAGMVWFQGYSDAGNKAYGEQLAEMIKWVRKEINAPDMPVVCGTMGVSGYLHKSYSGNVNAGMVYASQVPELKGTVDLVNTARYFPHELTMLAQDLGSHEKNSPEYNRLIAIHHRANSNKAFHYQGSAKFFLLAGDAMARSLANLMGGGQPMIADDPLARPVIELIASGKTIFDDGGADE